MPDEPPLEWAGLDRRVADMDLAERMLREGLARERGNMVLRRKLAGLLYDQSRLDEAIAILEPALIARDGAALRLRGVIACAAGDFDAAVQAYEQANTVSPPTTSGALALAVARRDGLDAASPIARAVLETSPDDWQALSLEASRLMAEGKAAELDALCAALEHRGARGAELFATWASAKAALEDDAGVRRLVDYETFLALEDINAPPDLHDFNTQLRQEILGHCNIVRPHSNRATYGGMRIDDLHTVDTPMVARLIEKIRDAINVYAARSPRGACNPLGRHPGGPVTLTIWALILDAEAHEQWHIHPSGLVSGVYYVDVPEGLEGDAGTLELGLLPLGALDSPRGWRRIVRPRMGTLVLFPSSYAHRTIATGRETSRISIAFDVIRA
jgi:tetratricopeptide (TPR) repeat protein